MFETPPREKPLTSWLWVALCTSGIFATIPAARTIVNLVRDHLGRSTFTYGVLAVLAVCLVLVLIYMHGRPKVPDWKSRIWLVLVGAAYAYFTILLKNAPEEAIHFLEYGLLGFLAFRALSHHISDWTIYISAAGICLLAGTLDEVIQWLTPERYFDFRDVGINALGGVLMQAALCKGIRPRIVHGPVKPRNVATASALLAGGLILVGLCASNTPARTAYIIDHFPVLTFLKNKSSMMSEYGYYHHEPEVGYFFSRFTKDQLKELDRVGYMGYARILNSNKDTPYMDFLRKYSPLNEPFLHEMRVHIFSRNRWFDRFREAKDIKGQTYKATYAYREQRLLEIFFGNTLSHSIYRWKPKRTAMLKKRIDPQYVYQSNVSSGLFTRFREDQLWMVIGVVLAALLAVNCAVLWMNRKKRNQ